MGDFYDLVDGDALGADQNQEVVHHSAPPAPPESEGPFVDDGRERRWQGRKPLKTDGQLSRQMASSRPSRAPAAGPFPGRPFRILTARGLRLSIQPTARHRKGRAQT
jgi:hypothetical protein